MRTGLNASDVFAKLGQCLDLARLLSSTLPVGCVPAQVGFALLCEGDVTWHVADVLGHVVVGAVAVVILPGIRIWRADLGERGGELSGRTPW